ncbi:hypothetical protein QFZ79_001726 [Arthrobacter sp. V4I6]|nr:hypothetical protein [Arthrobacter sp. V1I7]MDQ0853615.1 hypothetical protein [Arthrobacter sp. V4I6]
MLQSRFIDVNFLYRGRAVRWNLRFCFATPTERPLTALKDPS